MSLTSACSGSLGVELEDRPPGSTAPGTRLGLSDGNGSVESGSGSDVGGGSRTGAEAAGTSSVAASAEANSLGNGPGSQSNTTSDPAGNSNTAGEQVVDAQGENAAGNGGLGVETVASDTPLETAGVASDFTRLTRLEYRATVEQSLGLVPDINLLPENGRIGPFTSNAGVHPDPVHPYLLSAEAIAEVLIPSQLPACEASDVQACIERSYNSPLEGLFRRPLTSAELASSAAMLTELQAGGVSEVEATRAMLAAALVSPDFLYRSSPSSTGDAPSRRLAERLSYALWDAAPDAELTAAAEAGLGDLPVQVGRLLDDPRALPALTRFIAQWLGVDTDLRLEQAGFDSSPEFLELVAFIAHAVVNDTPVTEFISGSRAFVHRDNAARYSLSDVDFARGQDVVATSWGADSGRLGVLSQEIFAGSTRHPDRSRRVIFRGLLVRRLLMCHEIPAPTAELVALAGEVGERTEDARCLGCHQMIDPIGRAFAVLDDDTDGSILQAEVTSHAELGGTYADLAELLSAVASSRAFAECFSRHWLSFFLEQTADSVDPAGVLRLADAVQGGASLRSVVADTALYLQADTTEPWCIGE